MLLKINNILSDKAWAIYRSYAWVCGINADMSFYSNFVLDSWTQIIENNTYQPIWLWE